MATPTIEEYLETIYVLDGEQPPVRSAKIAAAMGVSAPTVTDTVKRLVEQGYVAVGTGKDLRLTESGREVAEGLVRRHRLSERWLVDVLGMDWSAVHEEACKLEHALSPEVEERLARALHYPSTCPHGNPIPGSGGEVQGGVPLAQMAIGEDATVLRVPPSGEKDPRLLRYLKQHGIVPGVRLRVIEIALWAGVVTVEVGESRRVEVSLEVASQIRAQPRR